MTKKKNKDNNKKNKYLLEWGTSLRKAIKTNAKAMKSKQSKQNPSSLSETISKIGTHLRTRLEGGQRTVRRSISYLANDSETLFHSEDAETHSRELSVPAFPARLKRRQHAARDHPTSARASSPSVLLSPPAQGKTPAPVSNGMTQILARIRHFCPPPSQNFLGRGEAAGEEERRRGRVSETFLRSLSPISERSKRFLKNRLLLV
ncbi:hypothetical protein AVEN_805-1 [Araneus ventricosus]|uniref:Uncharacterized protein n=1 Tax=Araneus ventricosus TaxID=182803 RepID=A0A4Y2NT86_ARAVE|nr:hypothetical protein AVEN_805-1 [Araneus ventricosus]